MGCSLGILNGTGTVYALQNFFFFLSGNNAEYILLHTQSYFVCYMLYGVTNKTSESITNHMARTDCPFSILNLEMLLEALLCDRGRLAISLSRALQS
jgi:hypothetical protein